MTTNAPREYDDLVTPERWPASALYHEQSKLTSRGAVAFAERIEMLRVAMEDAEIPQEAAKSYPSRPAVSLPRGRRALFGARLDDTLRSRRSQRGAFQGSAVALGDLGALLELSLGATGELAAPGEPGGAPLVLRAWPSAGALYPLEFYLVALHCESLAPALYHYDSRRHALASLGPCPARGELARLLLADGMLDTAAAALVVTGIFERTQIKYGERGYRFLLLEAGHAAQNVLLAAHALGLSAVPIGGFLEDPLGKLFGIDPAAESPVYVVLLGA
jgi:SagB-type dehydrogenase family enzyme